jgi:ribosomal protein L18E
MATNHCRIVVGVVIGAGDLNKEMVIVTLVISEKENDFLISNITLPAINLQKKWSGFE